MTESKEEVWPTKPVNLTIKACLFDMDGTLIDSSPAVVEAWTLMKNTGYPFLDLEHILKSAHGYRTTDALRKWALIEDPDVLEKEVMRFEQAILDAAQEIGRKKGDGQSGIVRLPGVRELINGITEGTDPAPKPENEGKQGWAICTSSTYFYASQAIPTAGIPVPAIFITAESVEHGKPAPDPYLLGSARSKVTPAEAVVFEDAPTGIRSGKAAGCFVIATCTSHSREALEKEKPHFLVQDLSHVHAKRQPNGDIVLTIEQPADRQMPYNFSDHHAVGEATNTLNSPVDTPLQTPVVSRTPSEVDMQGLAGKDVPAGIASVLGQLNMSSMSAPKSSRKGPKVSLEDDGSDNE